MTCFNRKETTLKCLESLFNTKGQFTVYLVDDNSTDGTYESVERMYPEVNLIKGTGDLFWNRGMFSAWEEAKKNDYNYYLWLNDDVVIYDFAIKEMLECVNKKKNECIISGLLENKKRNKTIYGGKDESRNQVYPTGQLEEITYLNGNLVLIPRQVFKKIGNLDRKYHHDLGDIDYGFRAQQNDIEIYSTRKIIGCGETNNISRLRKNKKNLIKRLRALYSPLGSNPNINFYFRRKHFGVVHAIAFYVFQIFLNLIPDDMNEFFFREKYK